jgi:hypothetical protein
VFVEKLGVRTETVESVVLALCYLLTEGAKQNTSELDFVDSLLVLGFSQETNDVLKQARFGPTMLPFQYPLLTGSSALNV